MKIIHIVILFLVLMMSACNQEPKIDTSTDETMKLSTAKVRQFLSEERREKFDEAYQILLFSKIDMKNIFALALTGANTEELSLPKMKEAVHGKTGEEIILAANEFIRKEKERERAQSIQEINELEEKKADAEKDKIELKKFKVLRSRFYKRKQEFLGETPIIELTVKNETKYPISRAYFIGTIASSNRAIPWFRDLFNYSIPGGLESGEEAEWTLSPNMFGAWGSAKNPTDAVFIVEVEQLDGADGEALFTTKQFSEDDEKRLIKLKDQYEM